jgi:hypothetical protein
MGSHLKPCWYSDYFLKLSLFIAFAWAKRPFPPKKDHSISTIREVVFDKKDQQYLGTSNSL